MGNVTISPNIKKESAFIDPNGNIIDRKTKQIIEENKPDYVPPQKEVKEENKAIKNPYKNEGGKLNELIEKKIASKIDEIISKRIDDILGKL